MINRWKKDKNHLNSKDSLLAADAKPQRDINKLDKKLISASQFSNKKYFIGLLSSKLSIILLLIIITLILSIIAGLSLTKREAPNIVTSHESGCSYQVLNNVRRSLDPSKTEELKKEIYNIKQLPEFENDANCLYVITQYYINISDFRNAKLYYSKLYKTYDPNRSYSSVISDVAKTPKELQPIINFLEQQDLLVKKRIEESLKNAPGSSK